MIARIRSFPLSADCDSRVLILGSMPGAESLRAGQYYAHPKNLFWDIMEILFGAGREIDYPERLLKLRLNGIALWDVLQECERPGSLDSDIRHGSVEVNDFASLFRASPHIRVIFFNGKQAAAYYTKRVQPYLPARYKHLPHYTLPSTSPANAGMSKQEKLRRWSEIKNFIES